MSPQPKHLLLEVDAEFRTGVCVLCGEVPIKWRGTRNTWSCTGRWVMKPRSAYNRAPFARTPEQLRDYRLKSRFGISAAEYDQILAAQDGRCAICQEECATGWRLAVDHCHRTGRIRGLLCNRCNRALGMFRDSAHIVQRAAAYISN